MHRLRLLALVVVALALLHNARATYGVLREVLVDRDAPRLPFALRDGRALARVLEEGQAAGLRPGDRLVEVAGRPVGGLVAPVEALAGKRPGEPFPVVVERDGARLPAAPVLAPRSSARGQTVLALLLTSIMPLCATLLGGWTVLVRPADRRAWLLLGLLLGFSHVPQPDIVSWEPGLREFGTFWRFLLSGSWGAFMMLFALEFPAPFAWERRRPWLKWLPAGWLFAAALLEAVLRTGMLSHDAAMDPLRALRRVIGAPASVLSIAAIGSFFAVLAIKAARSTSPDARRRLQILRWGTTVSLTPLFLVVLAAGFRSFALDALPTAVVLTALLSLLLFPATLAYVIVVERALDVRLALRMGARYLLVKNGLRLLIFAVMLPVGMGAAWALVWSGWPLPARAAAGAAYLLLILTVRRRAVRAMRTVDRRFFREVYDEEQILGQVGETLRTIVDEEELLRTLTGALEASLHVTPVSVLRPGAVPPGGRLEQALLRCRGPLGVYVDDPASWIGKPGALSEQERALLRGLRAQVVLPLAARDRLLAAIVLGPKRSEQPFTGTDLRLLRSVAAQAGLALEISRLTAAVAAESARRARVEREVEIARQVQEGLFPRQAPAAGGLDLAGHCRPAAGIGGDYYDYLALSDGRIGIAIGDVSGKGIPAALLMAGLQASLRGQRLHGGDLRELVARVNRLVFDATPPNRYATFFYGEYDPVTGDLRYVNAGHNPPVLLRADGAEPVLLTEGGMVVGLLPEVEFRVGSVVLEPGDLLVAYTDGVSEAMNVADEEWGTGRLIACARQVRDAGARDVLQAILDAATRFAGDAPQHDDMTLVVLRRAAPVAQPAAVPSAGAASAGG